MAESENIYVKIGERGRLIERTAATPRDHVNLKATGWRLKGSKGAATKKDEFADPPVKSGLTDVVPTSQRAQTDTSSSSSAGSAGARADAASQAAANKA